MRISILLAAVLSSFAFNAKAQTKDSININDLTIPTSPGFVLGDKSPSSIEKPSNPKALTVSLLQLYEGGAVEFNPYYLVNHPAYTFDKFSKDKFPIAKTIGISAATTKTDTSTSLSIGFRTQLVRIFSNKMAKAAESADDHLAVPREDLDTNALKNDLKVIRNIIAKPAFDVEIAAAYLGASNNNNYKNLAAKKWGAWLNIMWNPNSFPLTFVGLARYSTLIGAKLENQSDSSFFDYGLSTSYSKEKFDLSAEFVQRYDLIYHENYHRFTFAGNFLVNENIILVASIGKNFDKVNNILTVLGVKLGLSKDKVKLDLPTQ